MCTEAPGDIYELEHMGAVFSRFADGRIAQRPFGAAGSPRTVYSADITGHVLIHVLYEQLLKYEVPVYEEFFALDLVVDGGRCVGVLAWDIVRGGVHGISAHNTILATGGVGRMYYGTTNAYACTGDGMSMAWRAGVPLKDMEFMQFHPTTLKSNGVLITEGCRGEGALPAQRERRSLHGGRRAERDGARLARRRLARRDASEIEEGRGVDGCVLLDLTHLGAKKIRTRLPGSRELAMDYAGVDPILEPIPVRPGAHYHMGGVDTDVRRADDPARAVRRRRVRLRLGARRQPPRRQLADGDDHVRPPRRAATPAHEALANRNGALVAESAVRDAERAHPRDLRPLAAASGPGRCARSSRPRCTTTPASSATSERLERCLTAVGDLRERGRDVVVDDTGDRFNTDLVSVLELESMLEMADCLVTGALARQESRGAHTRLDHPERDDERWMRHTLAWYDGGKVRLDYKPVTVTRFEPDGAELLKGRNGWKSPSRSGARPTAPRTRPRPTRSTSPRRPRCSTRSTPSRTSATARSPIASRAAWPSAAPAACAWTAARCWPARRP